jgi:hypothetical protein
VHCGGSDASPMSRRTMIFVGVLAAALAVFYVAMADRCNYALCGHGGGVCGDVRPFWR